ncbi:unnamed protein product [Onchocerca flexuosa]|uniref:60S ribosomal protein L35a n=1 Tax=Onchocerca flexuosa TaxID=387005 RepID=A0A183GZW2_9BILA|nr:unnamed protein product [Onchocerca flexuosa]
MGGLKLKNFMLGNVKRDKTYVVNGTAAKYNRTLRKGRKKTTTIRRRPASCIALPQNRFVCTTAYEAALRFHHYNSHLCFFRCYEFCQNAQKT